LSRQLGDWIDGYIQYTKNTEPPEIFHLWCAISAIASVLQRKTRLEWGTLTFYPNMYVVLVAPSGKARKGTAMGLTLEFLEDLNIKLAAEAITREALIRELKNANANDPNIQTGQMNFHSSLTIFSPELTVFLGFKNEQLMSDLTDWYDCRNKWTYRTKNMGTDEITGVYVNLFGATTPDLLRDDMSLKAIGGGLTSRMIFVYAENKGKLVPAPFLTDAQIGLREQLRIDLERIHMLQGKFQATEGFLERWTEWYIGTETHPPFTDKMFSGYISRRPNHIMKLSMILNASRTDKMIVEKQDLNRAISILEHTEQDMTQTFSGVGKYSHADTLTQVMNEIGLRGAEGITLEELTAIFRNDANRMILREIIDTLRQMDYLDVITKAGKETYRRKEGGDA
jgi:hypothetical protein